MTLAPNPVEEIHVAYTCNRKKQRQFFDPLIKYSTTWQSKQKCPSTGKHHTIRLHPLFEDDMTPTHQNIINNNNHHNNHHHHHHHHHQHHHYNYQENNNNNNCDRIHAIIHKRTDDMATLLSPSPQVSDGDAQAPANVVDEDTIVAEGRLHVLQDALCSRDVIALDDLPDVWRVVDRHYVAAALERALALKSPRQTTGGNGNTPATVRRPQPARFPSHVPVVCEADGKENTHVGDMGIGNGYGNAHGNSKGMSFDQGGRMVIRTLPWTDVPVSQGSRRARTALECLKFPIILKRRLACGSRASHDMVIAHDMTGALRAVSEVFAPPPGTRTTTHEGYNNNTGGDITDSIIAQEFVTQHGGVLFKVYGIGEDVTIQTRASVKVCASGMTNGYFYFNSQNLDRSRVDFDTYGYEVNARDRDFLKPSPRAVRNAIRQIRREVDLSLIGVDLIYDLVNKCYNVIDVNYFPSFKGIDSAYESMLQMIVQRVCDSGRGGC